MHHSAESAASKKKEGEGLKSLVHCAFFSCALLFSLTMSSYAADFSTQMRTL